jgi:hypothetical protein
MRTRLFQILLLLFFTTASGSAQVAEPSKEILDNIQQLDRWLDSLPKDQRPTDASLRAAVDYQNFKSAIKFLKDHGNLDAAKALDAMLKGGELYSFGESEGQTSKVTNNISVRPGIVNPFKDNVTAEVSRAKLKREPTYETPYVVLDPVKHRQKLADLAATLYHEWFHTTQNRGYRWIQGNRNRAPWNGDFAEMEAWEATIGALQGWINDASSKVKAEKDPAKKLALVQELYDLNKVLSQMVSAYIENAAYWPFQSRAERTKLWKEYLKSLGIQSSQWKKIIDELTGPKPGKPGDKLGYLPPQLLTPSPGLRFYVPKESELVMMIQGQGRAAGHVFNLQVSNRAQQPLRFEIPLGLVLQPSDSEQQTMIVGESVPISVGPGESLTVEIPGYCLDPKKDPPKAGPPLQLTNSLVNGAEQPGEFWTFPEPSEEFSQMSEIIEAGNELSQQGAYSQLFPPQKTRETVIQRALWYARTENTPDEMGKTRLLTDLQEQLQAAGKNPDPKVLEQGVDALWDDVDLTLKKAKEKE